jgi:hypothetical protein
VCHNIFLPETNDEAPTHTHRRTALGLTATAAAHALRAIIMPLGLLVPLALTATAPATADPWGTGTSDTGAHPDGSTHNWCWGAGFDVALQDNVTSSMNNALGGPTDATVEFKSSCKLSGDGETDVVWFDGDLSAGTRGSTFCEDSDDANQCDQFYVTLDPAELNTGPADDELDTTKTTCHELGHTVGLTHGPGGGDGGADDCMISGERPSANIQYERYSAHHRGHINDWF